MLSTFKFIKILNITGIPAFGVDLPAKPSCGCCSLSPGPHLPAANVLPNI